MICHAQRRDRRIAAHEADQRALHISEAEPARDNLVDAGRHEAGAARHDQMRDIAERRPFAQIGDRLQRQLRRRLRITGHARRRRRGFATVKVGMAAARRFRQYRPAMLDARALRHAPEQLRGARFGDLPLGPIDEHPMHVMVGNSAAFEPDACGHFCCTAA